MPGTAFDVALRPAAGPVRLVRSTAAALACVAAAAAGHLTAGGTIGTAAVLTTFAGATAIAWLLSARRITPGQLLGLLVLCQVWVHLGCSTGEMHMSASMVAAHALATGVSALVLARGEAFVWQLAERLGLRVTPNGLRVAAIPSWRPLAPVVATRSLHDVRLAHSRAERGPPSGI
ncbi:hypothetical protein ASE12_03025 [Aeromicrobium sp. Root236]|uniref:hypothetical protein n=1 Tax=Aeromicrobium sp. Root236 TaxID=1736498 RepID=UPI0006F73275|nr:hypothetical protein [Aeromicrobium sp. Root236]KRC63826.1 hypothetical protein ASE12_03025 [Aeromicrobium sp. Root236]